MPGTPVENFEFEILKRMIAPTMESAFATEVLRWRFSDEDRSRSEVLAEKARAGVLTAVEGMEANAYGRVGSLIGILKSKARRSL
jgi:hypothetical protein